MFCEELCFPHLFPTGKYGQQVQREMTLIEVKYFNQRLLNDTRKLHRSQTIFFLPVAFYRIKISRSKYI